ncbi:hypothetical protein CRYPA_275 [uncultured Candidatus Thioglobus sp.]|nr:hypothetical protein CRYPA_275 [uncultured Candidatus Thioglobus sp.]
MKVSLDQEINNKVEWKDNTAGKSIKPQDIIAMSPYSIVCSSRSWEVARRIPED